MAVLAEFKLLKIVPLRGKYDVYIIMFYIILLIICTAYEMKALVAHADVAQIQVQQHLPVHKLFKAENNHLMTAKVLHNPEIIQKIAILNQDHEKAVQECPGHGKFMFDFFIFQ